LPLSSLFEAPTIHTLSSMLKLPAVAPSVSTAAVESGVPTTSVSEPARTHALFVPQTTSVYTPLVPIQAGTQTPFFCVHGAGGNVLNFQALAKRLGDHQAFYGLQAKGVSDGEPAHSIEEMAAAYIESIRRVRPHGPYLLGGYSGGGVVAYEMAQRLRADGEDVILTFLDTFHPSSRASPPTRRQRFEYLVAEGAPYLSRTGTAKLTRMVHGFRDGVRFRYYQRRGLPLPLELRDALVTQAFDRAATAYVPKRYEGAVTLFRARTIAPMFAHVGPTLGWGDLIPKLEIIEVPGDHRTLMVEPNVQFLISHLKALIATASG
jgi:thioesterase domain-containing protein